MKKNATPNASGLTREEWLRQAETGETQLPADADAFSRRALRGLRYAEDGPALRQSLDRLDSAVSDLARTAPVGARPTRVFQLTPRLRVAAALALILSLAALVYVFIQPPSADTLFARYFEPIDSAIPLTGYLRADQPPADLKGRALQLYEGKQYQTAVPLLADYLKQHPEDEQVRLYYGVALLAIENWEAAVDELERAFRRTADPAFQHTAQWYLALGYLRTGKKTQAVEYLRQLNSPTGSRTYGRRAEQLLIELRAGDDDATR